MENESLEMFTNSEFGTIRVKTIDGSPWFVTADICKALDIKNPSMAVNRLDEDERMTLNNTEGHSGSRGGKRPGKDCCKRGARKSSS